MKEVHQSKKNIYKLLAVLLLVIAAAVIYIASVQKIELTSSDSRWRAVCVDREKPVDECWETFLMYQGQEQITDLYVETCYDGEQFVKQDTKDEEVKLESLYNLSLREQISLRINQKEPRFCSLVCYAFRPKEVSIRVKWTENQKKEEAFLQYEAE